MSQSVQIVFRIDKASRDLARCFNINLSEVCRRAVEAEIGLQIEKNPNMIISTKNALDKYTEFLECQKEYQKKLLENITLVTNNLNQKQEAEKQILKKESELWEFIENKYTGLISMKYGEYNRKNAAEHFLRISFDIQTHNSKKDNLNGLIRDLGKEGIYIGKPEEVEQILQKVIK